MSLQGKKLRRSQDWRQEARQGIYRVVIGVVLEWEIFTVVIGVGVEWGIYWVVIGVVVEWRDLQGGDWFGG